MSVTIINQPMDYSCPDGEPAIVYVDAEGDDLTYQWWVKNANVSSFSKSSVKKPVYAPTMSGTVDGRKAYCEVSDGVSTLTTDTVTLTRGTTPPLQEQVCRIRRARQLIGDAIADKGVTVPVSATLDDMPSLIASI